MKKTAALMFPMLVLVLTGCSERQKADRLLILAQEETRSITAPKDRLKRLLNIAEVQIRFGRPQDARQSLADAAETLESSEPASIDRHTRLAGWISISELSRQALDKGSAAKATGKAADMLKAMEPVTDRPQYVRAIAAEIKELHGEKAAAELLVEGAGWAKEIRGRDERRVIFVSFADDAFDWEEYEAGKTILQCDQDPAWRVDVLVALATESRSARNGIFRSDSEYAAEKSRAVMVHYGRSLSYIENFAD